MNFRKIDGLQDVYPEQIEGTNEWYYCKIAHISFCDLYEAEEIVKAGAVYEGMNCVLIHFPDGTVYEPFELRENVYVDAPVFCDGKNLYCSEWYEDPDYHEKVIVRDWETGEVKDVFDGQMRRMPKGDVWNFS